jgi:chromosome segregation ATPase
MEFKESLDAAQKARIEKRNSGHEEEIDPEIAELDNRRKNVEKGIEDKAKEEQKLKSHISSNEKILNEHKTDLQKHKDDLESLKNEHELSISEASRLKLRHKELSRQLKAKMKEEETMKINNEPNAMKKIA